jgi:S1-C subfamily serine protease
MRTQQLLLAAAAAIGLVILLLLGFAVTRGPDDAPKVRAGEGFVGAVEKAQAATVMLSVSGAPGGPASMPMGSGFVISSDGLIVTAAHVTGGLPVVNAVFSDGEIARAELVGVDEVADVAVFRMPRGETLPALSLADSNLVKAGQPVVLVGSPFGLMGTATSGIVSAINRQKSSGSSGGRFEDGALSGPVTAYIQTDAALTAGGSGGPLLNSAGQVIGLASARESRGDPGAGLSFAIPSNTVKMVVDRFKAVPATAPPVAKP